MSYLGLVILSAFRANRQGGEGHSWHGCFGHRHGIGNLHIARVRRHRGVAAERHGLLAFQAARRDITASSRFAPNIF